MATIVESFPNHRYLSKEIAQRLGFKAYELELPSPPAEDKSDIEHVASKLWVLRGPDNVIWYHAQRVVPIKDKMVEIEPALSEEEMWERDCPDFFNDLNTAFSLLKVIPYHSIRLMSLDTGQGPKDTWEISYRPHPNKATYTELGPFLSVLIVNVFLECDDEVSVSSLPIVVAE